MEFYWNPPEYIPECDLTCYEVMKTTKYTYGNIFLSKSCELSSILFFLKETARSVNVFQISKAKVEMLKVFPDLFLSCMLT